MNKNIAIILFAAVTAFLCVGCGRSKSEHVVVDTETVEVQQSQLEEALTSGNLKQASVMADSMSLFVDSICVNPQRCVEEARDASRPRNIAQICRCL